MRKASAKNWQSIRKENLLKKKLGECYSGTPRIKFLRLKMGWTQSDIAKKLGTTQQSFSKWESKTVAPSYTFIRKFAELAKECKIKISVDDFWHDYV